MPDLPYATSSAGKGREGEIRQMLRDAGATAVGFMVDDDADQIICQFRLARHQITVPISIGAYEAAWLKAFPCGPRTAKDAHRRKARAQAELAVWAILADWIKAQTAMILCGAMTPDTAFLSHIHAPDGRRIIDAIQGSEAGRMLLPPPG
jgi:hypothetical protein